MQYWACYKSTFLPNTAVLFGKGIEGIQIVLCCQGQAVIHKYNRNKLNLGEDSKIEMKGIEYYAMDDKVIYMKYIKRRNLRLN